VGKFEKEKSIDGACKSRFLNNVFMLFDAILTAVFENMVFDPTKIIQGTFWAMERFN
jgi:hypothetical protein